MRIIWKIKRTHVLKKTRSIVDTSRALDLDLGFYHASVIGSDFSFVYLDHTVEHHHCCWDAFFPLEVDPRVAYHPVADLLVADLPAHSLEYKCPRLALEWGRPYFAGAGLDHDGQHHPNWGAVLGVAAAAEVRAMPVCVPHVHLETALH